MKVSKTDIIIYNKRFINLFFGWTYVRKSE